HPPVVRAAVAMGRPANVNDPVHQGQARPLIVAQGIEHDHSAGAAGTGTRESGADNDGTSRAVEAGGQVERMKPLDELRAIFLRAGHAIKSAGSRIDHRRSHNANIAAEIPIIASTSIDKAKI